MKDVSVAESLGRFLTLADAAELLSISAGQVRDIIRTGELPAIRVGARGPWRIERTVLESYIEALYEEARRMSLWNQSDFANIIEVSFGEPRAR
jgi:excisionase family DNA binding protein